MEDFFDAGFITAGNIAYDAPFITLIKSGFFLFITNLFCSQAIILNFIFPKLKLHQ